MTHATSAGRPARHRPSHARSGGPSPARAAVTLAVFAALGVAVGAATSGAPAGGVAAHAAVPHAITAPEAGVLAAADSQLRYARLASAVARAEAAAGGSVEHQEAAGVAAISDYFPASGLAASGIPVTALAAYEEAATRESQVAPSCGLTWPLLAGIGRVESDHGRFAGATLHSDGLSTPAVVGIPLNGSGTALILDTDGGAIDGDTVYDRAVGPMQFIPSTWAGWGVDANGDGVRDPFNIFDAAAAAADYLCAAGGDLTTTHGQVQAILSYNWSWDYVTMVMGVERVYASAVLGLTVPLVPTSPDSGRPTQTPTLPPVDPGTPRAASSSDPTVSASSSSAPKPGRSTTTSGGQSSSTGGGSSSAGSTSSSSSAGGSSSGADSSSSAGTGSSASSSADTSSSSSDPGTTSGSAQPCPTDTATGSSTDPAAPSSCPTPTDSSSGVLSAAAALGSDTSSSGP